MARKNRAKGTGGLILREGTWYAKWMKNGISTTRTTHIKDDGTKACRERAEKVLMDLTEPIRMRDRAAALVVVRHQLKTLMERADEWVAGLRRAETVGGLADAFAASKSRPDCSEAMLREYRRNADAFATWAGRDTPVAMVGAEMASAYAAKVEADGSPNTFNKKMNALSLVWRHAGPSDGSNPWDKIARKRLDTHGRESLTVEEIDRLLACASGEYRTLIAIGADTGLRLGDAANLRWESVTDGEVLIPRTRKTGAPVAIPLLPRLADEIRRIGRKASGFVVPGLAELYARDRSTVAKRVGRVFTAAGFTRSVSVAGRDGGRARPNTGFHSLRHAFTTRAVEAGIPMEIVKTVVGHANATMTEHYTHVTDEAVLKAFRSM